MAIGIGIENLITVPEILPHGNTLLRKFRYTKICSLYLDEGMPYLPDLSPSPCSSLTDSLLVFSPAVSGLARRNRWRDACFIRKLRINLKALSIAGYVNGNLMHSTLYRSPVNGYRLTVRGHTNENLSTDNRQLLTDHFAKSHKSLNHKNHSSDLRPPIIPNNRHFQFAIRLSRRRHGF